MGEKKGFFSRLVEGLTKTRDNIVSGIDSVFHGFSKIDDEFYEELEEILIMGDLGVKATESILDDLREKVKANHVKEPAECKQLLIDSIKKQMQVKDLIKNYTLQDLLDKLDVVECFKQPGKKLRVGEIVEKQEQLYYDLGVAPPTSL